MIRNKSLFQCVISIIILVLLIGCSSQQKIMIKSDPSQASVFVDTAYSGITPCVIEVKKKAPAPVVRLEKNGYTVQKVQLKKHFNIFFPIRNVLFGGAFFASRLLTGSLTDGKVTGHEFIGASVGTAIVIGGCFIGGIFTGDYYKFKPRKVKLSLDKLDNKINTIIKENKTSVTNPNIIENSNKTKSIEHTVNLPKPESQISEKKLKIGIYTTIITNTEKEFSGTLINESTNKYVLDINGTRLELYKNVVKDIQQ